MIGMEREIFVVYKCYYFRFFFLVRGIWMNNLYGVCEEGDKGEMGFQE